MQWLAAISLWGRDFFYNSIQNFLNALTGLGRSQNSLRGIQTNNILYFLLYSLWICTRQIYFVNNRNNFQIMFQGHIYVGQGLSLHSLSRIHNQQCTLTGSQASGYLIGKIHMARSINQVQAIHLPILAPIVQTNCLGLDGNTSFPFQIHIIQYLSRHFPLGQGTGIFNQSICNS